MPDLQTPARVPGSVDAEVDGLRVVLSPKDYAYFGIEGSGAHVWDLIDGKRSTDDIVAALEVEFDAPAAAIREETLAFLDALAEAGLVAESSTADPSV